MTCSEMAKWLTKVWLHLQNGDMHCTAPMGLYEQNAAQGQSCDLSRTVSHLAKDYRVIIQSYRV